jgi:uncharacterized membrane protein
VVAVQEVGGPDETPSEREFDYDRTVALSDGVFAIALTLLILNVEEPTTHAGFLDRVSDVAPQVGAYALSFAVLALFWMRHHAFFRDLRRIDTRVVVLNLTYLGLVAFIPFPTRLLADQGDQSFSVVAYAATLALSALLAAVLRAYGDNRGYVTGISAREPGNRALITAAIFGASIPVALLSPGGAKFVWVLLLATGPLDRALARRSSSGRSR